jgi:colicin import membrane protein
VGLTDEERAELERLQAKAAEPDIDTAEVAAEVAATVAEVVAEEVAAEAGAEAANSEIADREVAEVIDELGDQETERIEAEAAAAVDVIEAEAAAAVDVIEAEAAATVEVAEAVADIAESEAESAAAAPAGEGESEAPQEPVADARPRRARFSQWYYGPVRKKDRAIS